MCTAGICSVRPLYKPHILFRICQQKLHTHWFGKIERANSEPVTLTHTYKNHPSSPPLHLTAPHRKTHTDTHLLYVSWSSAAAWLVSWCHGWAAPDGRQEGHFTAAAVCLDSIKVHKQSDIGGCKFGSELPNAAPPGINNLFSSQLMWTNEGPP